MKQANFHFEDVAEVCTTLIEKGHNPTVKAVRAELGGGSNSRVLSFLQEWKENEESKYEGNKLNVLSKDIQNLISKEINMYVKSLDNKLKERIKEYKNQLDEIKGVLEKEEQENIEHKENIKEIEKKLTLKNHEIKILKGEISESKKNILAERKEGEIYRVEIAKLKGEKEGVEYLKKENIELKKELTLKKEKLSENKGQIEASIKENNRLLRLVKKKMIK